MFKDKKAGVRCTSFTIEKSKNRAGLNDFFTFNYSHNALIFQCIRCGDPISKGRFYLNHRTCEKCNQKRAEVKIYQPQNTSKKIKRISVCKCGKFHQESSAITCELSAYSVNKMFRLNQFEAFLQTGQKQGGQSIAK